MKLRFTKMHGAGNDFIVIEDNKLDLDWPRIALTMCDRHFGVGADGLLLIAPSQIADLRMKIYNADGSEAATCGNGIRCVARYMIDSGRLVGDGGSLQIETLSGISKVWFFRAGDQVLQVKVGMGRPSLGRLDFQQLTDINELVDIKTIKHYFPVNGSHLQLDLISIGNRHAVHFIDTPVSEYPLAQYGPMIEKGYSGDTNFDIARVLSSDCIEARVWENGVAETLACGSGACAIGVAAHLHGYTRERVNIRLPGGILEIDWEAKDQVYLTGPAEKVFDGEWLDTGRYRDKKHWESVTITRC